ncbi:MAG: Gfo/Idh/MocA family oxidoreductase [Candidatus Bathyarchaeota archaeon]|nr:Gfo/Idh/MocA family oxidoreductase [Candidatus Bathyarchaeota archaeon]
MKVGVIGCGGIAPLHIKAYKRLVDVEVVGLADLNIERAKSLAAEFNVPKTFGNYIEMFEKEKLDLVDICTPVSTHARIVCDASKFVPAVLVEKPMALSVSECDEIINEVKKHGTKLCIGHNQIFAPNIQKAKSMVDSGNFPLFSFTTTQKESFDLLYAQKLAPAWNVLPEQKGIIWEVCCHLAYLQLHFLRDITEVYAVGNKVKHPVYDHFSVLLRTASDSYGLIDLSWVSHETDIVYELEDFTGRRIQIFREFDYFLEKTEKPPFTVANVARGFLTDGKRVLQKWGKFANLYLRKKKVLPTLNLINSYIHAIKEDLPPPVTPEDGRKAIQLLECIQKSLDEKRSVKLEP